MKGGADLEVGRREGEQNITWHVVRPPRDEVAVQEHQVDALRDVGDLVPGEGRTVFQDLLVEAQQISEIPCREVEFITRGHPDHDPGDGVIEAQVEDVLLFCCGGVHKPAVRLQEAVEVCVIVHPFRQGQGLFARRCFVAASQGSSRAAGEHFTPVCNR